MQLGKSLQDVYNYWRNAMVARNFNAWKQVTATHRRLAVQNRVLSEKGNWPADVFKLPTAPPPLSGLTLLRARSKGMTAKAVYFGKVDFGVGGNPTENWKYDAAEFVSLGKLKDVRRKLKAGDLSYVDGEAFLPTGVVPPKPVVVPRAKYIAKIYTYCPGREVQAQVNRISRHRFQDTAQSEVVIGGARDGVNQLWYAIKSLPGYKGDDPITVRVYLMSEVPGVKPVEVYRYQTKKGEKPKPQASVTFTVDAAAVRRLSGR